MSIEHHSTPQQSPEHEGVAVDWQTAVTAMEALKAFYGYYNKANGAAKASKLPAVRAEMEGRMSDVDDVVAKMKAKAKTEFEKNEIGHYAPLAASQELIEAGFDPRDVEDEERLGRISLRRKIGTQVKYKDRVTFINSVKSHDTDQPRKSA